MNHVLGPLIGEICVVYVDNSNICEVWAGVGPARARRAGASATPWFIIISEKKLLSYHGSKLVRQAVFSICSEA